MSDSLANFATTGKLNFKGLVASILSDLAKMEMRIAMSKILMQLFSSYMGGVDTSAGSGGSSYATSFNSDGTFFSPYAKGGVVSSPSLSAYSGQIVNRPTPFKFAAGAGIMGEAGPEAIMPLSRGSDGKLGVKSMGAQGDIVINTNVTVDGNGNSKSDTTGDTNADSARPTGKKIETKGREGMTSHTTEKGR
ncbi:phage tail tape measure protein, partial [Rhodanobacter lindaniclasticus]